MQSFLLRWTLVLVLGFSATARAEETIRSFDSDIQIQKTGILAVTETITVNAEGDRIRHGIYRDFPLYFEKADKRVGKVSFDILSVERDGAREHWTAETIVGGTRIRIGGGDIVAPGKHVYRIAYLTDRQIRFWRDVDQLVWNVTGDGWQFPIEVVTARVTLPDGGQPTNVGASTGPRGAAGRDAVAEISGNTATFRTTKPLGILEGLTVDVQMPKDVVDLPSIPQEKTWWWRDNLAMVVGQGGMAAVFVYFLAIWLLIGRDPKPGVIFPQWRVPDELSPALLGYVDENGFPDGGWNALAASLIDLAVKGYVTLQSLGNVVKIKQTAKPLSDALPSEQQLLLQSIQDWGGSLSLNGAYAPRIVALGENFRAVIEGENAGRFYQSNRELSVLGLVVSLGVAIGWAFSSGLRGADTVMVLLTAPIPLLLGWLSKVFLKARQRRGGALGLIYLILVIVIALSGIVAFGAIASEFTISMGPDAANGTLVVWGLALLNQIFFALNHATSKFGREIKDRIAGLRMYLNLAEKDRMNLEGAEPMSPSLFEALLPYAIVLGVEKPWSQSFEAWIGASATEPEATYVPLWYLGQPTRIRVEIITLGASLGSAMATIASDFKLEEAGAPMAVRAPASEPANRTSSSSGSGASSGSSGSETSSGSGGGGGGGGGW
jgi:uncharacterized membrane protein YgcG